MSSFDPTEFVCIDEYDYERFRLECHEGLDIQEMRLDESNHEIYDTMEDDIPF